jgi:photosystem II stability/assembly factor-like uncharacterized protein
MRQFSVLLYALLGFASALGQSPATSALDIQQALAQKQSMREQSLVKNLAWRNVGPSIMSGRVVDLAVNPADPTEFYIGYASGGVWYTKNNGTSFDPVLDSSMTQNVGSLAVDWQNDIIWVGTGEVNASRSSYAGIGLLKSLDHGKSWQSMGLVDGHHISRILLDPNDPNHLVVGVVGHLYSENPMRGVYKTTDGGKSWQQTLFVGNDTGVIEMVSQPGSPEVIYASTWQKDRKAWHFEGSGAKSGIFKSTDSGDTWQLITTAESGFPAGQGVGRIGIAVYDENILYAIVDNQGHRPQASSERQGLQAEDFQTMTEQDFAQLSDKDLEDFLRQNGFQKEYTAASVKKMVAKGNITPVALKDYLYDANAQLFDTPVIGAEVYRSNDGGKSWTKTHKGFLDNLYYSYGYYFGKIHVSPKEANTIYIYGVPLLSSDDGGQTFRSLDAPNMHGDHHALWINPNRPDHLINGNDGGLNISYDNGAHWIKCNTPAVGQFYAVAADHLAPYNVYGGLQDNGVWKGSSKTVESVRWHQSGQYPYTMIMGGDGMQVAIDQRDHNVVFTGYQFGNYFRLDLASDKQTYIQPKHSLGERPYRFNWQTPILLSTHNQDILYLGSQKLHRSFDQGDTWTAISGDLTKGVKQGNVAYGTLTSISESPFDFNILVTGSDDGLISLTRDSGVSWTSIGSALPQDLWVSRVVASAHEASRIYVTLNGYRWDDFTPYVYVSEDFGQTWNSLASGLPLGAVNVIREDPTQPDLLYLGTDDGIYMSFDRGQSWALFDGGLPKVACHDLVVQSSASELVAATHGRSIYIADLSPLQQYSAQGAKDLFVITPDKIRHSNRWGQAYSEWAEPRMPEFSLEFFSPAQGQAKISLKGSGKNAIWEKTIAVAQGYNQWAYDLTLSSDEFKSFKKATGETIEPNEVGFVFLAKGNYTIEVSVGGKSRSVPLIIE